MKTKLIFKLSVFVFVMIFISCSSNVDKELNGTWISTKNKSLELKFDNGKFEEIMNGIPKSKGTYTTNENNLIMKVTHSQTKANDSKLYNSNVTWEYLYSFNNNRLILIDETLYEYDKQEIFTKKEN